MKLAACRVAPVMLLGLLCANSVRAQSDGVRDDLVELLATADMAAVDWQRLSQLLAETTELTVSQAKGCAAFGRRLLSVKQWSGAQAAVAQRMVALGVPEAAISALLRMRVSDWLTDRESGVDEAIALLERARSEYPPLLQDLLARLANLELARGRTRAAVAHSEELLRVATDASGHAKALVVAAEVDLHLGRIDAVARSVAELRAGIAQVDAESRAHWQCRAHLVELELARSLQDHERAEELAAALVTNRAAGPKMRQRARLARALSQPIPERVDVAVTQLAELHAEAVPALRATVHMYWIDRLLRAGRVDEAEQQVASLRASKPLGEATTTELLTLASVELRRGLNPARPLLEEWLQALERAWQRTVDEWRAAPPDEAGVAFLRQRDRQDLLALWFKVRRALGGDAAVACLQRYLEIESQGSMARRLGVGPGSVVEVQELARASRAVVLAYFAATVSSYVIVVTGDSVEMHELEPPTQALLSEHRGLLGGWLPFTDAHFARVAEQVSARLLPEPVLRRIEPAETLVFAGRELLHGCRFEGLRVGGHYLGLAKGVANVPSLALAVHMRERSSADCDHDVTLLVGSQLSDADQAKWNMAPVRLDSAQARAAVGAVHPDRVRMHMGASTADLLAPAQRARLLAVLAHGLLDGARARAAGLLLGPSAADRGGAVFADDLAVATRVARCVFLGVCSAARSASRPGDDGVQRLSAALFESGADAVISSEQDLLLDTAVETFRQLTIELSSGTPLAVALSRARQSIARQHPDQPHWAALCLEGLPAPAMPITPVSRGLPWSAIAGALAIAGLLVLGARRLRAQP